MGLIATSLERLTQRPATHPASRLALELAIRHYRELLIDGYCVI